MVFFIHQYIHLRIVCYFKLLNAEQRKLFSNVQGSILFLSDGLFSALYQLIWIDGLFYTRKIMKFLEV